VSVHGEPLALPPGREAPGRWGEGVTISTYCMVIGLAEFQVTHMGAADGVPISAWVFPEDAPLAARKLARSALVLERFSDLVAPFPFEKLAHQWWGDSVTPADWDDLWLSEGFATYFHGLFVEGLGGPPALREHMARAAATVGEADAKKPGAVVDQAVVEPAAKLSAFTYQKGAWVLHMLRRKLGEESFFGGLRRYYSAHAGDTATTEDLRQALEAGSGQDLRSFFRQWLYRPGLPELSVGWRWDEATRQAVLDVAQLQGGEPYELDVDLAFRVGDAVEGRSVPVRLAPAQVVFAGVRLPDRPRPHKAREPAAGAGSRSRSRPPDGRPSGLASGEAAGRRAGRPATPAARSA
jgi:aminopeptidase N